MKCIFYNHLLYIKKGENFVANSLNTGTLKVVQKKKRNVVVKKIKNDWEVYLMGFLVVVFYLMFMYYPMYGAVIAFQNYSPGNGFLGSEWVGFKHFVDFITSPDFWRLLKNTLSISVTNLIFGFPTPIIFALLINEITQNKFKRLVQSITYLPHFISIVVLCGLIKTFVGNGGLISNLLSPFIGENVDMLTRSNMFLPIYVISDIWQGLGWSSIIYIAALTAIDAQLYEAAQLDGAGKFRQLIHITLPGIAPTIIVMLILRIGSLLGVGYEKVILLYNPLIYDKSDIISSYVYRTAFEGQQWSYTTAIGLFNSIINFVLLVTANTLSKKLTDSSLW